MDSFKPYSHLDRELEKQVLLFSIEEGIYGFWEIIQNINHYQFLTLVDKHAIAYNLLKEILVEELAILEEFTNASLATKVGEIDLVSVTPILDNPRSWDLNGAPFYSLCITTKGENYLANLNQNDLDKLRSRLFNTE